ncbi:MAG: hypothetical protein ACYSTJ_10900, partial [Planctomycetota bacterium]
MERSNIRSVSIFIIMLSILLIGLVSAEAMADPTEEQKECTDSRCPNVNIGGEIDIELTILGQTLTGNFAFEQA